MLELTFWTCPPLTAMKTRIVGAKIACLDINLTKQRMHLGVHITIDDPKQLEEIRKRSVVLLSIYAVSRVASWCP